ncbi:hypothetical protein ACL02R_03825 [Streptomyces sp. MS19]|uniref:hypothetical protein n=1 Tax=Streptomyces sp. MS19 TaxID=3385972 RepID=UPI0039A278A7
MNSELEEEMVLNMLPTEWWVGCGITASALLWVLIRRKHFRMQLIARLNWSRRDDVPKSPMCCPCSVESSPSSVGRPLIHIFVGGAPSWQSFVTVVSKDGVGVAMPSTVPTE